MIAEQPQITCRPLTADRWDDIEELFGEKGACGGCWCMWWKLPRNEWTTRKGAGNKRMFRSVVNANTVPGIIAYEGETPVGWCAVEPRERYPILNNSRTLKPVDSQPVWSITCFFIPKPRRKRGISRALIEAAKLHARTGGARILEAYPIDTREKKMPDPFVWTGVFRVFLEAGFIEVERRSDTRPIMRYLFTD